MNDNNVFLLDSDSFITPYRNYYTFDIVPSYWNELKNRVGMNSICILDMVNNELIKNADKLTEWLKESGIPIIKHTEQSILNNYSEVIKYIESCGLYKQEGIDAWLRIDVADPWLIAASKAGKSTIVTFEKSVGPQLSIKNKSRKIRIPDVANHFGLETINLFSFMRKLNIKI